MAWSYDLLEPEQQRAFRALGVFVGGFDLDAVAAVVGLHAEYFHKLVMAGYGRTISSEARLGKRLQFDRANITAGFDWLMNNSQYVIAGDLLLGSLGAYEHDGLDTDIGHGFYRGIAGALLAYSGDYIQALAAMDDKPDNLVRHDHLSTVLLNVIPTVAVFHILLGQPKMGLERRGPLADVGFAPHHVRLHATEAAAGRLARQCNDAVLLLAELALVEGDHKTVVHPNEHAAQEQAFRDPANQAQHGVLGSHTAMQALHAELTRRYWDCPPSSRLAIQPNENLSHTS